MNICFPIGSFYPAQSGGPNNTIYWLAKALTQQQIAISVITTDRDINGRIALDNWLATDYGKVIYLRQRNYNLPYKLLWVTLKNWRSFEVLHLTSLFYPPSFLLATFAVCFKKKVIWSVRGELAESALNFSKKKKVIILKWIRLISSSITFHSTSPLETKAIYEQIDENIRIIELPNFMEMAPKEKRNPKEKYLLFVGRLHPIKGIDFLLKGIAKTTEFLKSDYQLKIVGDGEKAYVRSLKQLIDALGISHKVSFLGRVEGQAKNQLFANAYFLILPSLTENFGNVVLESLNQGTPVIASKGTPWQILEENKVGFWVANDPTTLANVLDTTLQLTKIDYQNYRKATSTLVADYFDIQKGVKQWITAYRELQDA